PYVFDEAPANPAVVFDVRFPFASYPYPTDATGRLAAQPGGASHHSNATRAPGGTPGRTANIHQPLQGAPGGSRGQEPAASPGLRISGSRPRYSLTKRQFEDRNRSPICGSRSIAFSIC